MSDTTEGTRATEATVSRGGVTAHQVCQDDRFGVPTVVITFANERPLPVRVRAVVELPPELGIEEVGFHPEYRGEDWEIDGGQLVFGADVAPGEEVTTLYAVGSSEPDQLASLLGDLSLESVTELADPADRPDAGPADGGQSDDGTGEADSSEAGNGTSRGSQDDGTPADDGGRAGRENGTGRPEGQGGADGPVDHVDSGGDGGVTGGEFDENGASATPGDGTNGVTAGTGRETGSADGSAGEASAPEDAPSGPAPDGTASADPGPLSGCTTGELLGELEERSAADGLSERDRDRLRALLPGGERGGDRAEATETGGNGPDGGSDSGVDPRVVRIQERLAAVEALLGPGPGAGESQSPAVGSADLDALATRVEAVSDEVATTRERVEAFGARLETLESRLADADGDGSADVAARIDALEAEVATLRDEIDDGGSDGPGYDAWPG